jgi:hypothetical protein
VREAWTGAGRLDGGGLLERDTLLDQLAWCLDQSRTNGFVAVVTGDAGVGKTALERVRSALSIFRRIVLRPL